MINFKNAKDRADILEALDLNMNEELRATIQYICHRIAAKDQDSALAESFKSAALDEMAHILYFSDLITALGGKPILGQWEIDKSTDIQTMLEKDIQLEKLAKQRYTAQLTRFKDYEEVAAIIKSVLLDEEDHEEVFTTYLNKNF